MSQFNKPKPGLNPNAKAFVPGGGAGAKPTASAKPAVAKPTPPPKAPPRPVAKPGVTSTSAGKMLDDSDKRTAGQKSPAHNRSQHVGKSDAGLQARGKPVATSYLTKSDQNKAASELLGSTKGANKINSLKADADGKTRTIVGAGPSGPAKPGATWNKTASITRVAERGKAPYNAKATQNQMDLSKKGGQVNAQTTYAVKPAGGFVALPKPAAGPSLKPTTKANVPSIAGGAAGLRKVPAPAGQKVPAMGAGDNLKRVTAGAAAKKK